MEEVIESTFSLLCFHHEHGSASPRTEKTLEPIHLLALLDIKATWFKKWMVCFVTHCVFNLRRIHLCICYCIHLLHGDLFLCLVHIHLCLTYSLSQHGFYSRTVVLRLLEGKYKSLVSDLLNNQYLSLTLCTSEKSLAP